MKKHTLLTALAVLVLAGCAMTPEEVAQARARWDDPCRPQPGVTVYCNGADPVVTLMPPRSGDVSSPVEN